MKVMMMMMMMMMMKKMIQDERSGFSALGAREWTTDLQMIIICNHFGICVYHKPMTTTCVGCKLRQPGAYAIPTPSVGTGQSARPTGFGHGPRTTPADHGYGARATEHCHGARPQATATERNG